MICPPYCSRHSQTRSTNASRPSSWRSIPWLRRSFSTTVWVPIPAWSVPRIHLTRLPSIRARRASTSWIVLLRPCPMCSDPVTFGGGIAIEKFSSALPSGSGVKYPASSQPEKSRDSTSPGS